MKTKVSAIPAVLLGLIVFLGGCGGSDQPGSIDKSEFLVRGNLICKKTIELQSAHYEQLVNETIEKESVQGANKAVEHEVATFAAETIRTMADELRDIGMPVGAETQVSRMLAAYERAADEAEERPKVFFTGSLLVGPNAEAKTVGLVRCSKM